MVFGREIYFLVMGLTTDLSICKNLSGFCTVLPEYRCEEGDFVWEKLGGSLEDTSSKSIGGGHF